MEQVHARAGQPVAEDGVLCRIGDGVVLVKAAEVVDARDVVELGGRGDAVDPPLVAGGLQVLPVVEGVAPELAGGGEVVRRAAGDAHGAALLVQPEDLGIGPGVRAVHGDVDRDVAKELDAKGVDVAAELLPLLVEEVLQELVEAHVLVQFLAVVADALGVAQADALVLPLGPGAHAEGLLDRHVERIVLQPAAVFAHEVGKIGHAALLGVLKRDAQNVEAQVVDRGVVHALGVGAPVQIAIILFLEQSFFLKHVQVDHVGVARIGGEGLIGRVPIGGRADGQDLPIALARPLEEVRELVGRLADGADAVGGRQRRDGHQNAGRSVHPGHLQSFVFLSPPLSERNRICLVYRKPPPLGKTLRGVRRPCGRGCRSPGGPPYPRPPAGCC